MKAYAMSHAGFTDTSSWLLLYGVMLFYTTRATASNSLVFEPPWKGCKQQCNDELICDFIPQDVPAGTKTVRLFNVDPWRQSGSDTLTTGHFMSRDWGKVIQLEIVDEPDRIVKSFSKFDSFCFCGLNNLKRLRISLENKIEFTTNTFAALDKLESLDFSGCRRLHLSTVVSAIRGRNIVPSIRALNLSQLYSFRDGLELDDDSIQVVHDKKIENIDLSLVQIKFVNFTALAFNCEYLVNIYLSRVVMINFYKGKISQFCPRLKYIDASFLTLPTAVFPSHQQENVYVSNMTIPYFLNIPPLNPFANVEYLDISGITPIKNTFVLDNVTILVLGTSSWHLKTIIIAYNNLERLDLNLVVPDWNIEHLDASSCKCQFINPNMFSSAKTLKTINLSNNLLYKMLEENVSKFEKLLENLQEIRTINIAGNLLNNLPRNMFTSNIHLEVLDLSKNRINQVTFDLSNNIKLKLLDLRENSIKLLNSESIISLNDWLTNDLFNSTSVVMTDLRGNTMTCSTCESLQFLQWILKSKKSINIINETNCINADNQSVTMVDSSTLSDIETICYRPKIILGTCISSALLIMIIIMSVFARRHYRRQKQYRLAMEDRIRLIKDGAKEHEFVVFLSYSSNDDDFVHKYVLQPLNTNLQRTTGEDRELVCQGDRYFQLGRPVHDQISCLLKRASVVVVVLSDNFCNSVHCRNEFDQAFMLEKPVILMVKGHVNVDLMTPLIMDIYDKRTRIHWHEEDGEYVLQTSWDNICTSVLDLVHN